MIHYTKMDWYWYRALKSGEIIEVVEAVEVKEAAEVLRPRKLLLRTSESSMFL